MANYESVVSSLIWSRRTQGCTYERNTCHRVAQQHRHRAGADESASNPQEETGTDRSTQCNELNVARLEPAGDVAILYSIKSDMLERCEWPSNSLSTVWISPAFDEMRASAMSYIPQSFSTINAPYNSAPSCITECFLSPVISTWSGWEYLGASPLWMANWPFS
jgi:hypothetical protein